MLSCQLYTKNKKAYQEMAGQKVCDMNTWLPVLDEFSNWLYSKEAGIATKQMRTNT